MELVFDLI